MPEESLTQTVGRLLRDERQRAMVTQVTFAEWMGTSQQWLSRVERGTAAPTTAVVERMFARLGLKLRVSVVPLEADLDERIDELMQATEEDRVWAVERHSYVLRNLGALSHVLSGRLAAFLQCAPVPAELLEVAIAEADLNDLGDALGRMNCRRWDERWREYVGTYVDPSRPGPLRWQIGPSELCVETLPALPIGLPITVGQHTVRVRPLAELEATDEELAAIMKRVRQRWGGAAPSGG